MKSINMKISLVVILLTSLISGCGSIVKKIDPQVVKMEKAGKAYYEEKCKNVAGEKIYRKIPDVEGVFLMKIRLLGKGGQLEDPMWPGAAFAREFGGDSYIRNFLGYEHSAYPSDKPQLITQNYRGYIGPSKRPGSRPGYLYIDLIDAKDQQHYRVTQVYKETEHVNWEGRNVKNMAYVLEKK